jgi:hypothetical protein
MKLINALRSSIALLCLSAASAALAQSSLFTPIDLSSLGSTTFLGVNDSGQVFGTINSGTSYEFFLTGANGSGITNLGSGSINSVAQMTGSSPFGTLSNTAVSVDGFNDAGTLAVTLLGYASGAPGSNITGFSSGPSSTYYGGSANLAQSIGETIAADGTTTLYTITDPNSGAAVNATLAGLNNAGTVVGFLPGSLGFSWGIGTVGTSALTALPAGFTPSGLSQNVSNLVGTVGNSAALLTPGGSVQLLGCGALCGAGLYGQNASNGITVNDLGQVGGFVSYLSGDPAYPTFNMNAFITTSSGQMVGIGTPGPVGDDYLTVQLNDLGQAIILDSNTGLEYFYEDGRTYSLDALLGVSDSAPAFVDELTNSGDMLVSDPTLEIYNFNATAFPLGGTSITSTATYGRIAGEVGAPPPSFFDTVPPGGSGGASVPEPRGEGLFAGALLLLALGVRRRAGA